MKATQPNRLANGGRIDRSQALNFRFNGKRYQGHAGDTLASALLANGVTVVGRSFKLHRPRGIVGSGAEESNAIMQIGTGSSTQPNLKATQVELYDGLKARSTKGWPSVHFDVGAISDLMSRVLRAGFYYKTFMYPRSFWHYYESLIRRSAGFGKSPRRADPDHYDHRNAHCDILVAGAGPAGLMAALAAAEAGARVIIADEQNEFGGSVLSTSESIDDKPAAEWLAGIHSALSSFDNVTMLPRSTVFGYYDYNFLTIAERRTDHLGERLHDQVRERLWRVRAKQVVLAQGAFERSLVFCNNDRPGVMLASAVSTYLNRYAVCAGKRAVVFTNNDSAYRTAIDLRRAGASVAIVDSRADGAGAVGSDAMDAGIPVMPGHIVTDVSGKGRISRVKIAQWNGDASGTIENTVNIDCDLLAMSGGWSPAVHLHSQSGGKNEWDDDLHCFVPGASVQECISAGAGNGKMTLQDCLRDGFEAGNEAVSRCGFTTADLSLPSVREVATNPTQALWRVPASKDPDRCPKQFIDFQTDASVADVRLAVREGYQNVEHVKRYTALGFGTDQGKLGNINGMAVLAETLDVSIPEVGTTTFRPAYTPVSFGVCAGDKVGDLHDPARKTAIHDWHDSVAAPMEIVGQWLRPWYFPKDGEDLDASVARECMATRESVGIMDASTLGKIDVQGPDAVTFLERIYTHNIGKMKIGRCAYGIMLGEDGMLMDDGVMTRLGEQHFYLTTTTGGAADVMSWLELWLQTEWPELQVHLTSLSDHYSTIAIAGPNSRRVLQKAGCSIDLEKDNFPFMSVRSAELAGMPVQLFRVSFSGELAFEVNIDSNYALQMWQTLMNAGEEFDITPYGTESLHVLRAEKGFVIVGQDTDGSVNPIDLKMNWLLSRDKDFMGKRSLDRPDSRRSDRKQYVGLLSGDNSTVLPDGAQLIDAANTEIPAPTCGHVTSTYYSACLGHPIALALVTSGHSRMNGTIYASLSDGSTVPAKICSPAFYDAKGERQNV
jgi:sarcosine oxidase, subunit alpha